MFQKKGTSLQQQSNFTSSYDKYGEINSCSSSSKKFIFQTANYKIFPIRENKGISPCLETAEKRSGALVFSRRLRNASSNGTSTGEGSKSTKVKWAITKTSKSETEGNAGKGLHLKVCHSREKFWAVCLRSAKKSGGNQLVINLKDLNWFIPYKHYKIVGLHCLTLVLQKGIRYSK